MGVPNYRALKTCSALIACAAALQAQSSTSSSGTTPAILAPGNPLSSRPLTAIESYSPYTGKINVAVPLYHVGGRGGMGYDITMTIGGSWTATKQFSADGSPYALVTYSLFSDEIDYQAARLKALGTAEYGSQCSGSQYKQILRSLVRYQFSDANGTQTELRDSASDGNEYNVSNGCQAPNNWDAGRGRQFVSRDGSSMVFQAASSVMDFDPAKGSSQANPNGELHLSDGTTYSFSGGAAAWMRDRNGNKITFGYTEGQLNSVTDQNGRNVQIDNAPPSSSCRGGSSQCEQLTIFANTAAAQVIEIGYADLSTLICNFNGAQCSLGSTQTVYQLFQESLDNNASPFTARVIKYILYPDGSEYTFHYNSYGEVNHITLPTGGVIEYDISGDAYTSPHTGDGFFGDVAANGDPIAIFRVVNQRREYSDGSTLSAKTTYTFSSGSNATYGNGQRTCTEQEYSVSTGSVIRTITHYLYGQASDITQVTGNAYNDWHDGKEFETDIGASSALVQTTTRNWQQAGSTSWCTSSNPACFFAPEENPQIGYIQTTLKKGGSTGSDMTSKQVYGYDTYNNVTGLTEYDFAAGSSPASTPFRMTSVTYYPAPAATSCDDGIVNLVRLPSMKMVQDFAGNTAAKTTWVYDSQTPTDPGIPNRDSCFTTSYNTRGNVSSVSRWKAQVAPETSDRNLTTTYQYDVGGNVTSVQDPIGNTAATTWAPPAYASPSKTTNALLQSICYSYDSNTGAKTLESVLFANGSSPSSYTTYGYDSLNRLQTVTAGVAISGAACSTTAGATDSQSIQTAYSYPNVNTVITKHDVNAFGDGVEATSQVKDGMGRAIKQTKSVPVTTAIPSGEVDVVTMYDELSHVISVTYPFASGGTSHAISYQYDQLGRKTSSTTDDGAQTTWVYTGNKVTVTDPSGMWQSSLSDAAGRLTTVYSSSETDPTLQTTYTYDALDNLTGVSQGQLPARSFVYDTVGRLVSATNLEMGPSTANSGTISYAYDNNGNVTLQTNADSSTISYPAYDALGRLTQKTYTDNTSNDNTSVYWNYDTVRVGSLTSVVSNASETDYLSYDRYGRVTSSQQKTTGFDAPFVFSNYSYNQSGALTSITYPSGRVVNYTIDGAGRPSAIAAGSTVYAQNIQYAVNEGLAQVQLNNNAWTETRKYDPIHQQLTDIKWQQGSNTPMLEMQYGYCSSGLSTTQCSNNNGNVYWQTSSRSGTSWAQSYPSYDALNRLTSANETGPGTSWTENFGYDSYANRWVSSAPGLPALTAQTPQTASSYNAKNQVTTWDYDSNGNLLDYGSDSSSPQYTYDIDNRMKSATVNGTTTQYQYDGDGRRVQKIGTSSSTVFVYDAFGNLAEEYSTQSSTGGSTSYVAVDALGSTRLMEPSTGGAGTAFDYEPFGEELFAGTDGRTTAQGFEAALVSTIPKFTGKERDAESGLDYFGARYYGSNMGRMMSPDAFYKDSHVGDPQSWNEYAYARNNPLRYVDPTGENATVSTSCTTSNNQTTCNVSISATIAIYADSGSGTSQEQLNAAASAMQSSIQGSWTGSFQQDGVTYNVSTQVSVTAYGSESAATNSGAQNVIGMTSGPIQLADGRQAGAYINPKGLSGLLTGGPDTGKMDINGVDNYSKHEFAHMLGTGDKPGEVLSNTDPELRPDRATGQDYRWGLKEATSGVNGWVNAPQHRSMRYGEIWEKPSGYSGTTSVGAPFMWWK